MTKYGHLRDIRLVVNNYTGVFYYKNISGKWLRFNKINSIEMSLEMLLMFKRVGHSTKIVDKRDKKLARSFDRV